MSCALPLTGLTCLCAGKVVMFRMEFLEGVVEDQLMLCAEITPPFRSPYFFPISSCQTNRPICVKMRMS